MRWACASAVARLASAVPAALFLPDGVSPLLCASKLVSYQGVYYLQHAGPASISVDGRRFAPLIGQHSISTLCG